MRIERARPLDFPGVAVLLTEAGLPLDGAAEAFAIGVVARDAGQIIGAAALESYGRDALLRSLVVAPSERRAGVAANLVSRVEDLARAQGVAEVFLITETAAAYFLRLGYTELPRYSVPNSVAQSIEFTTACSTSATVMRRHLN